MVIYKFPPVACIKSEALCYPANLIRDSDNAELGCCIYEESVAAVILEEQMCRRSGSEGFPSATALRKGTAW